MKKISVLLPLLFSIFTSLAFAADKPGDSCPKSGYVTSQVGDAVLTCVDGKIKLTGQVGSTRVTLSLQLMDGDKRLLSTTVITRDGMPTPISIGNERSYISQAKKEGDRVFVSTDVLKEGFFMTMTPTIQAEKIAVDFVAMKSEITSMTGFSQGDLEVMLPQVKTIELKQNLLLDNGKEMVIPFGPLVAPTTPAEAITPLRPQFTLKLVATAG